MPRHDPLPKCRRIGGQAFIDRYRDTGKGALPRRFRPGPTPHAGGCPAVPPRGPAPLVGGAAAVPD